MIVKSFDASKYLTDLRGRDYLEVKWRLLWLRTEHPDANIQTELVKQDEGLALFRALVSIPGGGEATPRARDCGRLGSTAQPHPRWGPGGAPNAQRAVVGQTPAVGVTGEFRQNEAAALAAAPARFVAGRPLVLGGVHIESDLGADGHSDAEVLMHAATDAVLGALALGDLGTHFPNDEDRWRNAESSQFLRYAVGLIKEKGYAVGNIDSVIDLERPKLRPHINEMRANLAEALGIDVQYVSVKAKTGESVDTVGERRAVRAQAVVLLVKSS